MALANVAGATPKVGTAGASGVAWLVAVAVPPPAEFTARICTL